MKASTPTRDEVGAEDTTHDADSTLHATPDKNALFALARRWRVHRLGCPRGCPLDHHEEPCHLARAEVVV